MAGAPGQVVEIDGLRLHVVVDGEGPAVLLLHGFPDSSHLWRHQMPVLTKAGFTVISPDLRGFGESDRPEAVEAYRLEAVLGDVSGILDALAIERANVVVHAAVPVRRRRRGGSRAEEAFLRLRVAR